MEGIDGHEGLIQLLEAFMHDEGDHRDDATSRQGGAPPPFFLQLWARIVDAGSRAAVGAARLI